MVTLEEIAERAGVTTKTVSNVLRGHYKAGRSDAARRARDIRVLAESMGYRVNAAARATRTGRTGLVGMVSSFEFAFSVHVPAFEQGLMQRLYEQGSCLVKDLIDEQPDGSISHLPRIIREGVVDGVLINYAFGTPPMIRDALERWRIPAIWINRKRDANCVRPDDTGAGYEATMHLIRHGHRRIRYSDGPDTHQRAHMEHYSRQDRQDGYTRAMTESGLQPTFCKSSADSPPKRHAGHLFDHCVSELKRPESATAYVCNGHGRTLVAAAMALGRRVPQDVCVVDIDNDASAGDQLRIDRLIVPHLSMGRAAAEELLQLIQQPQTPRRPIVLPFGFEPMGTVAVR